MALICINGARECTGCMECQEFYLKYQCPVCGKELYDTDEVYIRDGEVIGCEYCVITSEASRRLKGEE